MRSLTPLRRALFAIALALIAAPVAAQDRVRLILDWFINPDHGPIVIAQEMGYFAEAGLDVEIVTPADPNSPPRMVAAGEAELAVSYQPHLHLAAHEGLPLVRVGTLVSTPLTCLAVLADGPVNSVADLKGRKVGFAVAGVQEALMRGMLRHNGLTDADVEMINIGWSISPALMSRQVDAVIGAFRNFELTQMALEGAPGRCFYPEAEGVPAYDELIYVANPALMDRALIARFLGATEKAVQTILNAPEATWETFAATAPELRTELNRQAWLDTYPRFASRPAAMDAGRYAAFEAFLHDLGFIDSRLDADALSVDVTRAVVAAR